MSWYDKIESAFKSLSIAEKVQLPADVIIDCNLDLLREEINDLSSDIELSNDHNMRIEKEKEGGIPSGIPFPKGLHLSILASLLSVDRQLAEWEKSLFGS